jgi:hypothetical protein
MSPAPPAAEWARHTGPPRAPLHLAAPLAAWLRAMAAAHNCGSTNKTLRDLLGFYSSLSPGDLRCVLADVVHGRGGGGGGGEVECDEPQVHVTRQQAAWLAAAGEAHGLDVDAVLARLVAFARDVLDEEVLFEARVRCATNTADLYCDCDIFSNAYSPVYSPGVGGGGGF